MVEIHAAQRLMATDTMSFETLVKKIESFLGTKGEDHGDLVVFEKVDREGLAYVVTVAPQNGKDVRVDAWFGLISSVIADGGHLTGNTEDDCWKFLNVNKTGKPAAVLKEFQKSAKRGLIEADHLIKSLEGDIKLVKDAKKMLSKL